MSNCDSIRSEVLDSNRNRLLCRHEREIFTKNELRTMQLLGCY